MAARKPAIAFIFVTLFLDVLGIGLIIPILPKLIEQFEGGSVEAANVAAASHTYGLLAALYSLMQFLFSPLLGSLSDRYGRRPVILCSLFGSGLDYLVLAVAPNLTWLFVGRIVSGITGANIAAAGAYIADVSPPEKRAQSFGIIGAAFGLGFIAGPALGGILGAGDLRLPFYAAAALTLLNWLYGLVVLPESLKPENHRAFSWRRSNPIGSLAALSHHPIVFGLTGTFFLLSIAHQSLPGTWVLYTSYRYQWTPKEIGLSLAVVGIMAAVVQGGLTRFIIPRVGEKHALVLGLIINAVNFVGYAMATEGWMIYLILVIGSLGGISGPAAQGLISRNVAANEQGAIQGSLNSLNSIAGIIGPVLATKLFGYFISPQAPVHLPGAAFYFAGFLTVIAMLLAVRSFRKQHLEALAAGDTPPKDASPPPASDAA